MGVTGSIYSTHTAHREHDSSQLVLAARTTRSCCVCSTCAIKRATHTKKTQQYVFYFSLILVGLGGKKFKKKLELSICRLRARRGYEGMHHSQISLLTYSAWRLLLQRQGYQAMVIHRTWARWFSGHGRMHGYVYRTWAKCFWRSAQSLKSRSWCLPRAW